MTIRGKLIDRDKMANSSTCGEVIDAKGTRRCEMRALLAERVLTLTMEMLRN